MKKGIILLTVFCFLAVLAFSQKQGRDRIDSLVKELALAKEDTFKVKLLNGLSFSCQNISPDTGIQYAYQAYELAERLSWPKGMAMADNSMGANYRIKSDYPKALEYFFKALKVNEDIGEQVGVAQNFGNIGIVYKTQGEYNKALEFYQKALDMFGKLGDKNGMGTNLGNIGIAYESLKDYPRSLEYQKKALKLYEELGNKKSIAHNLANIGLVYAQMGDHAAGLDYVFKALAINQELANKKALSNNYRGLGEIYIGMAKVKNDNAATANAITYLSKGLAIASEIGDMKNLQEIHDLLSKANALSGNYKAALEHYQQYVLFKDSIFSGVNAEKIAGLITKRELDIRDKEILIRNKQIELDKLSVAKKRNERGFYITGIAVLLLVIAVVVKTNRLLRKEKLKSEGLLLNILPSEIAQELKEKGSAEARFFDDVTILFTDFVNFTEAGERMASQELLDELNICFKEFDAICGKYNIEKIKTIGDAYLAVSGLPRPDELHALNVVHAAIEIRDFMCQRERQLGDKTFKVRIGVHSGSVVAGIVGVKKFAYDIWGDTVNTAARMEQNSAPGKINISESTYELVKERFLCQYRGELDAKNKGLLKMYFLEKGSVAELVG